MKSEKKKQMLDLMENLELTQSQLDATNKASLNKINHLSAGYTGGTQSCAECSTVSAKLCKNKLFEGPLIDIWFALSNSTFKLDVHSVTACDALRSAHHHGSQMVCN